MQINVAYGANNEFSKYTYTSILSLLTHTKKTDIINCYLLTSNDNYRIYNIKQLKNKFQNFQFSPVICDTENIKQLKVSKEFLHLNYATYYRFFIDKIEHIDKILYLDGDTIITQDISSLYQKNLNNSIIGIVSDSPNDICTRIRDSLNKKNNRYFNTGMMLINLKKRKTYNVSSKCLKLLRINSYPCNDQDALNIVLEDHCERLEGQWNVQTGFFNINNKNFRNIGFNKDYYNIAKANPYIIHFTGQFQKPRLFRSNHPLRREYDKIKRHSYMYNLKDFKLREFIILLSHTIEYLLIPKYENRKKLREYIHTQVKTIQQIIHKLF